MGFWGGLTGRSEPPASSPAGVTVLPVEREPTATQRNGGPISDQERWYVRVDDPDRFKLDAVGLPPFHLVSYDHGEVALRLCEDATGLLVGPTDRRLFKLGVYSYNAVGEYYHPGACRSGDFTPGARVRLVRQPDNEHDPNAVAIKADRPRAGVAAYLGKGHAKRLAKVLDAGTDLEAIATRGTGPGVACESIAVLAAEPRVMAHLLSPRPDHLPAPVFLRG